MAFDQIQLFLYPPGWQQQSVPLEDFRRASGQPVRMVSSVRDPESSATLVSFEEVFRWFEQKGFRAQRRHSDYAELELPKSRDVRRAEIDVCLSAHNEELTNVCCRFLLHQDTPRRLNHWASLIRDLCAAFPLRISISDYDYAGADRFLSVLRTNRSWHHFATQFGWPDAFG